MNDPKAAAAYHPGDVPVTRPDLDAISYRARAANEGPWFIAGGDLVAGHVSPPEVVGPDWGSVDDAEFIAHARDDIPALLAALTAEQARADQAAKALVDAPHERGCGMTLLPGYLHAGECFCWKSTAPTAEQ